MLGRYPSNFLSFSGSVNTGDCFIERQEPE